ncbi:MAG: hypothetical protein ACM359_23165, partial [Bacillota bacterium]
LIPSFIDREDVDIFRIVDDPEEAARLVKVGVKKPWWQPLDVALAKAAANGNGKSRKTPMESGSKSMNTGEGTRYGKRPRRSERSYVARGDKPTQ